jgi:hypothetical protein
VTPGPAAATTVDTPPPISGTTYYVSSTGNDSNSGTSKSSAWKTINKVNSFVFKAGDGVLFQGGGPSFTGSIVLNGTNVPGSSSTKGLVISSYDNGPATLTANAGSPGIEIDDAVSGITISNLILRGNTAGSGPGINLNGTGTNFQITNNDIGGFFTKTSTWGFAEISLNGSPSNIYIGSNVIHGLNGPSSPDNQGIGGNGGGIKNVTVEKNLVYDIGGLTNGNGGGEGNGMVLIRVTGALVQLNVVYNIAGNVNTCGGGCAIWTYQSDNVVFQFNEAYHVRPISFTAGCDWDGFDLDGGVTNSTMQYNYSHDNFGGGFVGYIQAPWSGNTWRYNVSVNNGTWGSSQFGELAMGGPTDASGPWQAYNNTLITTNNSSSAQNPIVASYSTLASGTFLNNIMEYNQPFNEIVNLNGASQAMTMANNDYFTTLVPSSSIASTLTFNAVGSLQSWISGGQGDKSTHFVDPMAVVPASAKTAAPCFTNSVPSGPAALANCVANQVAALQNSSSLRGAGVDVTKAPYNYNLSTTITSYSGTTVQPAQDFFGNPVPGPKGTNIGADGH